MGTGIGKSLCFMLLALASTGITVVVVPILALKSNLKDRCIQAGIKCIEWDSQRPYKWASVVLIVPESAVSASFEAFVNQQRAIGRLDRIVVDKCHIVLELTQGWQTCVLKLRNLVMAETQLVYLTATLKPREETEFLCLMGLPPKEQCAWFWMPTTQPDIAYWVHCYNQQEQTEADVLAKLVQEKKDQYPLPSCIIVFCNSVLCAKEHAATLGTVCYYCDAGLPEQKLELLRQLTRGWRQVIVATSALGLGVDYSHICAVFFVGQVRRLWDFVQQLGRASCDGAGGEAIVVQGASYSPEGRRLTASQFTDIEAAVHEIVEGDSCIRVVINREIDGNTTRVSCTRGEAQCSWCQEREDCEEEDKETVLDADKTEFQR